MKHKNQKGQALVMLLFFVMVGVAITTAATFIIASNSLSASDVEIGESTLKMAESGIEKALLQILRGNYTNFSITDLPNGTVDVTVANGNPITIDSTATNGSFVRKVRATVTYNGIMNITSWKEVQ